VELPVFALNLVLTTATDLWALRYPDTHELYALDRPAGGSSGSGALEAHTARISARSSHLAAQPAVVIASEKIDDDSAWRLLDTG
jgi:glutamine amidotransferase